MTLPGGRVRAATAADAPAIASINVRAWQVGYRGLLPGRYLDRLAIPGRISDWEERIANPPPGVASFVYESPRSGVIAYCIAGPWRRDTPAIGAELPENTGEIIALYSDPDHWGSGAGAAVLEAAMGHLRATGNAFAALWMLQGNTRTGGFYERRGWRPDGGRLLEPLTDDGQLMATEVRYVISLIGQP